MPELKTIIFTPRNADTMIAALGRLDMDEIVSLVPDPENERDPNAIACEVAGNRLGYLLKPAYLTLARIAAAGCTNISASVYGKPIIDDAGRVREPAKIKLQWTE